MVGQLLLDLEVEEQELLVKVTLVVRVQQLIHILVLAVVVQVVLE